MIRTIPVGKRGGQLTVWGLLTSDWDERGKFWMCSAVDALNPRRNTWHRVTNENLAAEVAQILEGHTHE